MTRIPLVVLAFLLCTWALPASAREGPPPNIVWIIVDDMSADFSCYGQDAIRTPNLDRLAAKGVRFTGAFVTGPICSPCRSALITGMYQTSIGAHHHRSGRGVEKIHLPGSVKPVPRLFREAGYLTLNLSFDEFVRGDEATRRDPAVGVAKTDYNFQTPPQLYDTTHWRAREAGQPFFVQVQLHGGKHRGGGTGDRWPARVEKVLGSRTPASAVRLPAYLPDDPVIREDWAQYLDTVRYTDWEVGRIVDRLKAAGELDRTIICFMTDHGISHVRNKQFLYDGGIHVPLVVRGPGIKAAAVRQDLVEHIDLAATSLKLAGIERPQWMQGRDLFAADYQPRKYVFSARDRADETVDRIRAVRSDRFKYVRNYYPARPYLQPNAYKDGKPIIQTMRRLHAQGKLTAAQSLIMRDARPKEELYDVKADPLELQDLAEDPAHAGMLVEMRAALADWEQRTGDQGRTPETAPRYDSDMAAYLGRGDPQISANIELMKRWAVERPHSP